MSKEANARIKINKLPEEAGWPLKTQLNSVLNCQRSKQSSSALGVLVRKEGEYFNPGR